jgi:hypothetical protein
LALLLRDHVRRLIAEKTGVGNAENAGREPQFRRNRILAVKGRASGQRQGGQSEKTQRNTL